VGGDVNGDGHAETVVGQPFGARPSSVHLFYGHRDGLVADARGSALDDQVISRATPGVPGTDDGQSGFGLSSVLADLNGDGCADLAVGAPDSGAGSVVLLYGSHRGVTAAGAQRFTLDSLFGDGTGARGQQFGVELTAGDLNGDQVVDLVVGAPGDGGSSRGGRVAVVYGSALGAGRSAPSTLLSQAGRDVPGAPERGDRLGAALAVGDFDGDGVGDLAAGAAGENRSRGLVVVFPGRRGQGVGAAPATAISQSTPGVAGRGEAGDEFGAALAAGDVTGDGRADLAVGAPAENGSAEEPQLGEGAVSVFLGSATGLSVRGSQRWSQHSPGVDGVPGSTDRFGYRLVIAPLDDGRFADLAVGAPGDSVGSSPSTGSVTLLLGSRSGLITAGAGGRRYHQNSAGVSGVAEINDSFGAALAASRIQGRTRANLVVGSPGEELGRPSSDQEVGPLFAAGMIHQLASRPNGPTGIASRSLHLNSRGVKGVARFESFFGIAVG
jgi:hypothetical protein